MSIPSKTLRICCAALMISMASIQATARYAIINSSGTEAKSGPSAESATVEGQWGEITLNKGEIHKITGEEGDWLQIQISGFGNQRGYVPKKSCISDGAKITGQLPDPEVPGYELTADPQGCYWLKSYISESAAPIKGVWVGNALIFPCTMSQRYGESYEGEDYEDIIASFVKINTILYPMEYYRTD